MIFAIVLFLCRFTYAFNFNSLDFDIQDLIVENILKDQSYYRLLFAGNATKNAVSHLGYSPIAVYLPNSKNIRKIIYKDVEVKKQVMYLKLEPEALRGLNTNLSEYTSLKIVNIIFDSSSPVDKLYKKYLKIKRELPRLKSIQLITKKDGSLLNMAIKERNITIVKELVKLKLDINEEDFNGRRPIFEAIASKNLEIVKILVENGAKLDYAINFLLRKNGILHSEALDMICFSLADGSSEISEYLIDSLSAFDFKKRVFFDSNTLNCAAKYGNVSFVRKISTKAPQFINYRKSIVEASPLEVAIDAKHADIVSELIKFGADVHFKRPNGLKPIVQGVLSGNPLIIRALYEAGADIHEKYRKEPLLIVALRNRLLNSSLELLNLGVDVDVMGSTIYSSLILALVYKMPKVAEIIVDKTADIDYRSNNGNTALMVSLEMNYPKIAIKLLNRNSSVDLVNSAGDNALILSAKQRNEQIFEIVLNRTSDINHRNKENSSALSIASSWGANRKAQMLIFKGANVNIQDVFGNTPIFYAVSFRNHDLLDYLLSANVDLDIKNKSGETALMWAARDEYHEMCVALLSHGANPDLINYSKKTAYQIALKNKSRSCAELLNPVTRKNRNLILRLWREFKNPS